MKNKIQDIERRFITEESSLCLDKLKDYYREELISILSSVFKWTIPDNIYIPPHIIERELMTNGLVAFYEDEVLGLIAPKIVNTGELDFYNLPVYYNLSSYNGAYTKEVKAEDLTIIYNNSLRSSFINKIELYSQVLAEIELIKRQNLRLSRGFIKGVVPDNKQELAVKSILDDWLGFKSFIMVDTSLANTCNLETGEVSFKGIEYNQYKKTIIGDFLQEVGIKAIDIEKGSHILNAEASRSELSSIKLIDEYLNRLEGVKALNKLGYNIKVELDSNKAYELIKEYNLGGAENEKNNS